VKGKRTREEGCRDWVVGRKAAQRSRSWRRGGRKSSPREMGRGEKLLKTRLSMNRLSFVERMTSFPMMWSK
jgi:hypothetical protein